jgi:hypothetical protein
MEDTTVHLGNGHGEGKNHLAAADTNGHDVTHWKNNLWRFSQRVFRWIACSGSLKYQRL